MKEKPSIDGVSDSAELPDWQKKELDRRLEVYRDNPDAGSPWEEIMERIMRDQAPS